MVVIAGMRPDRRQSTRRPAGSLGATIPPPRGEGSPLEDWLEGPHGAQWFAQNPYPLWVVDLTGKVIAHNEVADAREVPIEVLRARIPSWRFERLTPGVGFVEPVSGSDVTQLWALPLGHERVRGFLLQLW